MSDPLLRLLVGISVIGLSAALLVWHRRAWHRHRAQLEATGEDARLGAAQSRSNRASSHLAKSPNHGIGVLEEEGLAGSPDADGDASSGDASTGHVSNGHSSNGHGNGRLPGATDEILESIEVGQAGSKSPYSVGDQEVLRHYRWQMLQRSITSAGIGLIGVMMILSAFVSNLNVFAFGLFFTVLLVLAVFTSAMVDAFRTQMFFRKNDQGFREAKRALLKEYARLKAEQQSSQNPSSSDHGPS